MSGSGHEGTAGGAARAVVQAGAQPGTAARVATGVPVLDHLVGLLAARGSFDVTLEIAPGSLGAQVAAAGTALGEALAPLLRQDGARGFAASTLPAGDLDTGLRVFSDSIAQVSLIGAGIVVLALLAALLLRMFRNPGAGTGLYLFDGTTWNKL